VRPRRACRVGVGWGRVGFVGTRFDGVLLVLDDSTQTSRLCGPFVIITCAWRGRVSRRQAEPRVYADAAQKPNRDSERDGHRRIFFT
jgi:hypothetical protein